MIYDFDSVWTCPQGRYFRLIVFLILLFFEKNWENEGKKRETSPKSGNVKQGRKTGTRVSHPATWENKY